MYNGGVPVRPQDVVDAETVSSADIVRNFGVWQDRALHVPVVVTNRGRPRYVLMSIDAWQQAKATLPTPVPIGTGEAARAAEHKALIEHMAGGFLIVDPALVVREASTTAAMMTGRPVEDVIGSPIDELLDRLGIGIALPEITRVLESGEETRFDLPCAHRLDQRLRGHVYPWVNGVAISLRQCYETPDDLWRVEQRALERARLAHPGMFAMRIGVRGTIATVDDAALTFMGLPRDRVLGARLVDLLALSTRATARDAIEAVLGGTTPATAFDGAVLTNDAQERRVVIALAPMAEGFAIGGAVVLFTALASQ